MRNEALDVIMICKGCYNKNKYEHVEDALASYYKERYLIDDVFICKELLNKVIINKTVHWLMENAPDRMNGLMNAIFTMEPYFDIPNVVPYSKEYDDKITSMDFDELLFYKMIKFFKNLKMNGDCITIDASDYYIQGEEPSRPHRIMVVD